MALDTMEGCVAEGVDAYAKAELKLRQAQKAILEIIPIIEAGNGLLMMGALQTHRMIAELKAAAGVAARSEVMVWRSHRESTDIAIANDVDIVGSLGGGPR